MDDVEIRTMMEIVKKRINDLEHEAKIENIRDAEAEGRDVTRLVHSLEYADKSDAGEGSSFAQGMVDDSLAAAKDILNATENLKAVHSAQSVAAIYRSAKDSKDEGSSCLSLTGLCDLDNCHPRKKACGMFVYQSSVNVHLVPQNYVEMVPIFVYAGIVRLLLVQMSRCCP